MLADLLEAWDLRNATDSVVRGRARCVLWSTSAGFASGLVFAVIVGHRIAGA